MKNLLFLIFIPFLMFSCTATKKVSNSAGLKGDADQKLTESTVDLNDIKAHIHYLASDEMRGRNTPSPELNIAARYLSTTLMRYGVKPLPGCEDYLQKVPMKTVTPADTGRLKIGTHKEMNLMTDFLMLDGENIELSAETVFVNRGTAKDYENVDVKGKIAVSICGYAGQESPQEWFYAAQEKQALSKKNGAVAHLEVYKSAEIPFFFLARFFSGSSTMLDDGVAASLPLFWVNATDSSAIASLRNDNKTKCNIYVDGMSVEQVETYNVVGMIAGSDPELKKEHIIYSAHYDHIGIGREVEGDSIYNGARDNAVGSVTVLSAAENIALHPTKRSALFIFFTGEEKGLLGSQYYAENPLIPLDQVTYCFNSDNAGYNDTSVATIIGLERTEARNLIEKACTTFGLKAIEDKMPEQGLFDRSDNVNFARQGVPAPTFSLGITAFDDTVNTYYHQAADGPNTLDYAYLHKFFKSYVYACRLIGNTSQSVFWKEGDKYYDAGKALYGK